MRRRRKAKGMRAYQIHKEEARVFIHERLAYFNEQYQKPLGRIAIRNQRTRWGSCSVQGNLNFNYRLVKLPRELADYVIVHELCHLTHFNHSSAFWDLVGQTLPHYKHLKAALRRYQI